MLGIAASNSIVAIQLKKAINQKGLKQASVATKAGYSAQELNDMLNGNHKNRELGQRCCFFICSIRYRNKKIIVFPFNLGMNKL